MTVTISSAWGSPQPQRGNPPQPLPKKRKHSHTPTPSPTSPPTSKPSTSFNLSALASPAHLPLLPKIQYIYDPTPTQPLPLPVLPTTITNNASPCPAMQQNAIPLHPDLANLPLRTTIPTISASKHWSANLSETRAFLSHLASDKGNAADIPVKGGITLSKLAKAALKPGMENGMVLASQYMFPFASSERIRHVAALTVMYFIFDDKVEETRGNGELRTFRDDFLRKMDPHLPRDGGEVSGFQRYVDGITLGIEREDATGGGDGGREMIESLQRDAFKCVHPPAEGFKSVEEYLRFRRENVGASFVIAAIKYSIASRTLTSLPHLSRFLHLSANHLSIVNDLFSYDKELEALERGDASDMINIVDVVKKVTGLRGKEEAKGVVLALLREVEGEMWGEVMRLRDGKGNGESSGSRMGGTEGMGEREREELGRFMDAVVACAGGHVFFCMTTSRYGREGARVRY